MPVILGHEFSGVVTSVGRDVKHLKQGDNVVVDPNRYPDDNAVLISDVNTTNATTRFCTICLSNEFFFHNSDPSQHPEYKLHAEYKPWRASLCNFLSCSANLFVWDQILAYTESQKVVIILNVYTVDVPHLLHWYCVSNKVQESVCREKHIQCVTLT